MTQEVTPEQILPYKGTGAGAADGNGIYSGGGTLPDNVEVVLADKYISFSDGEGNPCLILSLISCQMTGTAGPNKGYALTDADGSMGRAQLGSNYNNGFATSRVSAEATVDGSLVDMVADMARVSNFFGVGVQKIQDQDQTIESSIVWLAGTNTGGHILTLPIRKKGMVIYILNSNPPGAPAWELDNAIYDPNISTVTSVLENSTNYIIGCMGDVDVWKVMSMTGGTNGSFTTNDGQTVTVYNGIITGIS